MRYPAAVPSPTRIEPLNPTELLLCWDTGERFALPYRELRYLCPCAACVDELTGQRTLRRESVGADVRPREVRPVGRYAISVRWSDGHSTGMYAFDRLWEICQSDGRALAG